MFETRLRKLTRALRALGPIFTTAMLPVCAAGVWTTSSTHHWLALATPIAGMLFYAGYALFVERSARALVTERIARIDVEVQRRLASMAADGDSDASTFTRFVGRLRQEISRAQRYQIPVALIVLRLQPHNTSDTDARWSVNAQVLRAASDGLRTEDVVGYLGGYEYAFCLPHTNRAGAEIVLERLKKEFSAADPAAGLAIMQPQESVTPDLLLGRAREDALRRRLTAVRHETWNEVGAVA